MNIEKQEELIDLKIIDIAEELAYQLASTQLLFRQQTFLLGDSYFLLSQMPIRCVTRSGTALHFPNGSAEVIDLAICNSEDSIILAVAFETTERNPQEIFDTYFPDMNRLIFRASEPSQEYLNRLQNAVMEKLYSEAHTGASLPYQASGFLVCDSSALLAEKGLLYDDGTVTPYGALCGLFKMYVGGHSESYYPVVCPDSLDALNAALN